MVVFFDGLGTDALFSDKLHLREKEVQEETPFGGVEIIHHGDHAYVFEALVTEILADVGPVFAFDMSVVIFLVLTASSVLDRSMSMGEVFKKGPVQEFTSIVAIETTDAEGQPCFNALNRLENPLFAFTPDSGLLGPTGGNVGDIDGIDEHSSHRGTAVGHSIGFKKSGDVFIPLIGFDRDVLLQQRSWFGRGKPELGIAGAHRTEETIDRWRRDFQKQVNSFSFDGTIIIGKP